MKKRVNETDKIKQREESFNKVLKQMGPENDKYYVKYNQNLDIILEKMGNLLL